MNNRLYDEERAITMIVRSNYGSCRVPFEELMQIAWVGYLRAVENFDSSKADKMSMSYASKWIRYEINKELNNKNAAPLEQLDARYDEAGEDLEDTVLREELYDLLYQYASLLSDEQYSIIERRYLIDEPMTLQEICDELGYNSKQRVKQIEDCAILKLREYFEEE